MNRKALIPFFLFAALLNTGFVGSERLQSKQVRDDSALALDGVAPSVGGGLPWVLVDSMNSAFSMLSNSVKPLAFDQNSGIAVVIHRGHSSYGGSSLGLWYNMTTDGGAMWNRTTELCTSIPSLTRYPSATISPLTDTSGAVLWFAAPQLNPSAFGYVVYGFGIVGAGTSSCVEDQGNNDYGTNVRIAAADDSPYVWMLARTNSGDIHVWVFADSTYQSDPWSASDFTMLGGDVGLAYRNGTVYAGVFASFPGDPGVVFNVAYSASTDFGGSWGAWSGPNIGAGDWRTLPGIAGTGYTDWHPANSFDMVVDANGYVHFFGILVDDDTTPTMIASAEIFENGSGWEAKIVSEDLSTTTRTDSGLVDLGYHVSSAISADGMAIALTWLSAPLEGDTVTDIFGASRYVSGADWSPAENYSNTPDSAEVAVQVAPILRSNGGDSYTMFLSRADSCRSCRPPCVGFSPVCLWVSVKDLTIPSTQVDEDSGIPSRFRLEQNYPNPFNPTTTFEFAIHSSLFAHLSIYNLLGEKVGTIVNGRLGPGNYVRQWDASGLPGGVYFYRLAAGDFVQTRKLVLLR
jgi:hypothetical protein